jgi:acyl-[acyl carrier protein]--UDP-N-acetylglucosamine O-acyltransferase
MLRVTLFVLMVAMASEAALAQSLVTFPLTGTITEVDVQCPRPDAFAGVMPGDSWWLTYTFDATTIDVDGSASAGQYRNTITDMTLTIGSASVSGAPGTSVPVGFSSVIAVNLTAGFADYVVQAGFPDATAWATVILQDDTGTPFVDDSLPLDLPTPLAQAFPDLRAFSLRPAGSSLVCVAGSVSDDDFPSGQIQDVRTSTTLVSSHTATPWNWPLFLPVMPGDVITLSGQLSPQLRIPPNGDLRGLGAFLDVDIRQPNGSVVFDGPLFTNLYGNYELPVTAQQYGYIRAGVDFLGNASYRESGSNFIVPVIAPLGPVIVVAGGGETNTLFPTIEYLSDMAVNAMRRRGVFDDPSTVASNRIRYLHPDLNRDIPGGDGVPDVDAVPSVVNLQVAITSWAAGLIQMTNADGVLDPDAVFNTPLTLYLVGDFFDSGGAIYINESETVNGTELASYLDTFEQTIIDQFTTAGVTPPASIPINVIIEGPSSGTLIAPLSKVGRVILTSTCDGCPSFLASAGSVSFSAYFLSRIVTGHYIHPSFAYAQLSILSNPALAGQNPQIEATGNGVANEIADEIRAAGVVLEYRDRSALGARPRLQNGLGRITLRDISAATLWVYADDPENQMAAVEALIVPPSSSFEESRVIPFIRNLAVQNRWEGYYDRFFGEGIYTIVYTATDNSGKVANPIVKHIIVSDSTPPLDISQLTIVTSTASSATLQWATSESPDTQGYNVYTLDINGDAIPYADAGNVHQTVVTGIDPMTTPICIRSYDRVPLESPGICTLPDPSEPPAISDDASVADDVQVGDGTVIGDAVIGSGTEIGSQVIIRSGARIAKNVSIGTASFIGADSVIGTGAVLRANVSVGDQTSIGPRVLLDTATSVGSNSTLYKDVVVGLETAIGSGVEINQASTIGQHVLLANDTRIGRNSAIGNNVELKCGVVIDQAASISDFVIVEEGAVIKKTAEVEADTIIRAGALINAATTIGERVTIGEYAVVPRGSIIPDDSVVNGLTLDQQQPTLHPDGLRLAIGSIDQQRLAQVVTAASSESLAEVRLPIYCESGNLTIDIQSVVNNRPSGLVLASNQYSSSDLAPPADATDFRRFGLTVPVAMTPGTQFAIVLSSDGMCSIARGGLGDTYVEGVGYYHLDGGWITLPESLDLPFYGFHGEPSKIGFGEIAKTGCQ